MSRGKSRTQRWHDAVTRARKALDDMANATGELDNAMDDLLAVQEEYEEWQGNLPENLGGSALAEKLDQVVDIEISDASSSLQDAFDSISAILEEAEGIDLPRGFGRD